MPHFWTEILSVLVVKNPMWRMLKDMSVAQGLIGSYMWKYCSFHAKVFLKTRIRLIRSDSDRQHTCTYGKFFIPHPRSSSCPMSSPHLNSLLINWVVHVSIISTRSWPPKRTKNVEPPLVTGWSCSWSWSWRISTSLSLSLVVTVTGNCWSRSSMIYHNIISLTIWEQQPRDQLQHL